MEGDSTLYQGMNIVADILLIIAGLSLAGPERRLDRDRAPDTVAKTAQVTFLLARTRIFLVTACQKC